LKGTRCVAEQKKPNIQHLGCRLLGRSEYEVLVGLVGHIRTLLLGRSKQLQGRKSRIVVVVALWSLWSEASNQHLVKATQVRIKDTSRGLPKVIHHPPSRSGSYSIGAVTLGSQLLVAGSMGLASLNRSTRARSPGNSFQNHLGTRCRCLSFLGIQAVVVTPGAIRTVSFLKLRHPFSQSNLSVKATPKGSACKGKVA